MPLVVRAFPVLPGKEKDLHAFASELAQRQREASEFFRHFCVKHESWYLQHTPNGPWVIGVTELTEEPQKVAQEYAGSERPFDRWFKGQVLDISGIDQDHEPLGPPTEKIFEWSA